MSWKEYKKKKEQEKNETNINISNKPDSQISSWEKYKQEKEMNNIKQLSSWENFKKEKEVSKYKTITSSINSDENKGKTWFKGSNAFDDGYQFGDILGTAGATLGDFGLNLVKGVAGIGEGIGDAIAYGVADVHELFGNDTKAERIRNNARDKLMDSAFEPLTDYLDQYSVLGEKTDDLTEGLGYVAGITAISIVSGGVGGALGVSSTAAATIGSTAATFTSAMGNGITDALDNGATIDEARIYGAISGAAEAATEFMFGGLGKASGAIGLSKSAGALDDVVIGGLTKNIKNKMAKTAIQAGLKASGEGLEEVVSGLITAAGKKITYMNEKELSEIIKDENLAEQFWMGALTSAIAQGPSTISSVRHGTDYITGRTTNEQKVYDSELKSRISDKVKQATIEQTYNEQIKAKENLGIEITEELKAETMQKVEKAYENGTLESIKLSKKDLGNIEKQVETDLKEGNISSESIMKTLGENQDISKDSLLMKSMYENEQKYNSYKVEQTDNEKVNILMQSAADAGMNNTTRTRKKVELISKLVKDTNRQYKFVSSEQLKELGYNENANGLINKSTGEILINAHSTKGLQSIIGHETTHIFDSKIKGEGKHTVAEYSKEYQTLQDFAIEYAKVKGIYDSKIQSITSSYSDLLVDESQIKEELTADLVGDFLFNDEKFIENLAVKDKNVFQKIYDYIKHVYKMVRGTAEEKAFEKMKNQFEKVYKTVSAEINNDTKYSIAGEKAIENIKNTKFYKDAEDNLKLAKRLKKEGKSNLQLIKETGWFQDKAGDWKFEFSDKHMELKEMNFSINKAYSLSDVLEHDELFYFYPELANYTIIFNDKTNSSYSKKYKTIYLSNYKLDNLTDLKGTLIHEIQHAIQDLENHAHGASAKLGLMRYYNTLGEIEAADTKQRYLNNLEGKRNTILPESAKKNPIHPKIKNANVLVKIANGVYNFFHGGEKNVYKNKNSLEQDFKRNRPLVVERGRIKYSMKESENNSGSFNLPLKDNQGRILSKEQQEYFKESKARDENGNLLEVYHGTNQDFTKFDISYLGSSSGDLGFLGDGFYLATHKGEARYYGSKIMNGYVNIRNPYNIKELSKYNGKTFEGEDSSSGLHIKNLVELNPQWRNIEINNTTYGEIADEVTNYLENVKVKKTRNSRR